MARYMHCVLEPSMQKWLSVSHYSLLCRVLPNKTARGSEVRTPCAVGNARHKEISQSHT